MLIVFLLFLGVLNNFDKLIFNLLMVVLELVIVGVLCCGKMIVFLGYMWL